jgi:hypothetical protein
MVIRELVNLLKFKLDESSLHSAEQGINRVVGHLNQFGAKMTLLATAPIMALAGFSVKVASDTNEIQNKFNQVFGSLSDDANRFASTFSKSVGRFAGDTKQAMSAFQSMFVGLGFGSQEASNMSKRLETLTIDFGSFNNISDQETMSRFIAAMSGSAEVLDQFGVNIREQAIEQELLSMGLHKSAQTATEMEKATARLNIIEKTMGRQGAIGDAVRTMDQFANKSRGFIARLREIVVWVGQKLLPILSKGMDVGFKLFDWFENLSDGGKRFLLVLIGIIAAIGPLTLGLAGLLSVVKGLMLFNTFLGGLAGIKTMGLAVLQPQFLLIAAAIVAAVAALALFIEDVSVWVSGGDSMIGKLLGPWERYGSELARLFKLATTDFSAFIEAMVQDTIRAVGKISTSLDNTKVGQFMKFITGISGVEYASDKLGYAYGLATSGSGGLRAQAITNNAQNLSTIAAARTGQPARRSIEVKSTINMQVPDGTVQTQIEAVDKAARRAAAESFDAQMQRLLDNEVIE